MGEFGNQAVRFMTSGPADNLRCITLTKCVELKTDTIDLDKFRTAVRAVVYNHPNLRVDVRFVVKPGI